MHFLMAGVNYRTAQIALRERLALTAAQQDQAAQAFRARYPQAELVLLSTCNRVELYIARAAHTAPDARELPEFLAEMTGVEAKELAAALVMQEGDAAVAHLFRVTAGLDAMVLGESQIQGQVKRAYEAAVQRGVVGTVLHRVFQQAMAVAKQVRTQTGIDAGRVSVGSTAVDFARQVFDRFDNKTVVAIGAGEMAKLTLTHLRTLNPKQLWIANRTLDRAQVMAGQLGLEHERIVRRFEDLDEMLVEADVLLTSTGAMEPIITEERMRPLLKRRRARPLFILDIAVPRDVAAEVGKLRNIYLYNIDDLQKVIAQTQDTRQSEARKGEEMLAERARVCLAQLQHQDVGQIVRALRTRLHELGDDEQRRTMSKLRAVLGREVPADAEALLEEHTRRVINKILHLPLSQLDQSRQAEGQPVAHYAAALRRLFQIEELMEAQAAHDAAHPAGPPEPPEPPEPPASAQVIPPLQKVSTDAQPDKAQ